MTTGRFYARSVQTLGRLLGVEVCGIEQIPQGRALLVANHAFGFDVAFPIEAISRVTGRQVWALGEHLWWKVPVVRRIAASVGVVDGRRDVATRLLSDDQLVVVLPGGLREAVKPRELRYALLWGHWRSALHQARVLSALRLLSAPGATTERVAKLAGFRSPSALCHTFAVAGLPSPGALAREARRDPLVTWADHAR